ncbi:mammalian cell entry protein, partial [Mycobacterium sp. ITM-2017-0098]
PTVELCNDPRGFVPTAMRNHITGPYPFDPNLVSQGVPIDSFVEGPDRIYLPTEGTPLPPGAVRAGTPPVSEPGTPPFPVGAPAPMVPGAPPPAQPPILPPAPLPPGQGPLLPGQAIPVAPSAYDGNESGGPTVGTAQYDPQTGQYLAPDGALHQVTNVAAGAAPKSWKDLLPM